MRGCILADPFRRPRSIAALRTDEPLAVPIVVVARSREQAAVCRSVRLRRCLARERGEREQRRHDAGPHSLYQRCRAENALAFWVFSSLFPRTTSGSLSGLSAVGEHQLSRCGMRP